MRVQAKVVRGRGAPQLITLEAASLEEGRKQAIAQGYTVLECRRADIDPKAWLSGSIGKAARFDVHVFVEQLRDLLLAGLSVIEALDALRRGADEGAEEALAHLDRSLRAGQTLSGALAEQARFPPLLVALVHSSELTSDLPQTLTRFLDHEQRVSEVRHRLVSLSIYPLLLMGVGALVLLFLFFYVMPRFARIFDGMAGELPWSAKMMLAWSQFLASHAAVLEASIAVAVIVDAVALTRPTTRVALGRALLSWKPLERRFTVYFLARWYRCTGMLVTGGIPLPQALNLSRSLLPESLQQPAAEVEANVRAGLSPAEAHVRAKMATPIAEQLLIAGERTGDLGAVLMRVAQFHEAEVSRALERTMRALEPLVMVMIGLGVGVVVVLMYMPIFELASAIQ